jgi:pimeloyl-ACP methyl ester carboxylesterase
MTPKPSIVWVPGSFTLGSFYDNVAGHLRELGYEVIVKQLPSASRVPPEKPATMYEDALYYRAMVELLADQGKDVVLVTHSYGGVVGSEAARNVLKTEREKQGKPGGLIRLVFVTSVIPAVGGSLKGLMGELVPSYLAVGVCLILYLMRA